MDEIQEHQRKLLEAFGVVLRAEDAISDVKRRQEEIEARLKSERSQADQELATAWGQIQELLNETGEVEVVLPGTATDYKIGWSSPSERVIADPEAIPDQFCKIERKPRLKEIGEFLKGLRAQGLDFPNWAAFERGERKLMWKAIKRKAKE